MKGLLIISNLSTKDYFHSIAKACFPSLKNRSICHVTSNNELNAFNFKDNYDEIWILVELCWDLPRIKQGYDLALELMQMPGMEKEIFNISFFSFFDRKTLLRLTSDEKNIFPKAFSHYQLPLEKIALIESVKFDSISYNFIRNYTLSKSNIISDVLHRLETVLQSEDVFLDMVDVIHRLRHIKSILSQNIISLLDLKYEHRNQVNTLYEELLQLKHTYANIDEEVENSEHKRILRTVVLLEDNKQVGEKIKNWLEPYCDDVIHFSSGELAIAAIKKYSSGLDLLLCDLELLDENMFWQKVQGVQVLEYVKQNFPQVYTVVLSGLPTQAVNLLIPERSYINKHIRKKELFNSDASINDVLLPILKRAKIYSRRFSKGFPGPDTGKLKLIRERYFGLKLSEDSIDQSIVSGLHEKASILLEYYEKGELLACDFWGTELLSPKNNNKEDIWSKLPVMLGIRKMILKFIVRPENRRMQPNSREAYCFDYLAFKEPEALTKLPVSLKTFIQTHIGFNVYGLKDEEEKTCYIKLENLFIEEAAFVDSLRNFSRSEPILNYESFKLLEAFMIDANSILGESYFDLGDNPAEFENKLSKLTQKLHNDQTLHRKMSILCSIFPFAPAEIPVIHKSLQDAARNFLALEDTLDV